MGLSNRSRALLASLWMNPRSTLRYEMVDNVPSDEADAVLGELFAEGLIWRETEPSGAISYGLTGAGAAIDRRPPGETLQEMSAFMQEHGNFPLSKPRPAP